MVEFTFIINGMVYRIVAPNIIIAVRQLRACLLAC